MVLLIFLFVIKLSFKLFLFCFYCNNRIMKNIYKVNFLEKHIVVPVDQIYIYKYLFKIRLKYVINMFIKSFYGISIYLFNFT